MRAPETLLGLPVGPGIDIWSFGCLAFLILTGHHLFPPCDHIGNDVVIGDVYLIQFSEVIGPLPETIFTAWSRATSYFSADRQSRLSDMLRDGEDGTFEFLYEDADIETQIEEEESGDAILEDDHERDDYDKASRACSEKSDTYSVSTIAKDPLVMMARCHSLEERFREHKPEDIDEAEEQQILHLLRWIFQHDAARRPTVDEILAHPWFHT